MGGLQTEVEAAEVGFDQKRLDRIDRHFARYVDEQKLAGWLITVARHGKLAHVSAYGQRDIEAGLPVEADSLWRIYSMTKPITSVAAMMLYEEGGFELTDPLYRYIPSFREVRVFAGGSDISYKTVPAAEPIRILAPAVSHLRSDLRLHAQPPGGRDLPRPRLRVGLAARR